MPDLKNIDFSIIVLCYKPQMDKLKNTIISSIKQKNVSYEVIVVDDGSPFTYEKEIKEWVSKLNSDVQFKYVFSKVNQGTIRNYLNGIEIAEGKYIKPISPGDYFLNEYSLERYKKEFDEGYDVIFADAAFYADDVIVLNKQFPISNDIFNEKKMKKHYCFYGEYFVGATISAKKDLIAEMMKEAAQVATFSEDLATMLFSFFNGASIKGIPEELMFYEYGYGISTTSKGKSGLTKDNEQVYQYIMNKYPEDKIVKKMQRRENIWRFKKPFNLLVCFFVFPNYLFSLLKAKYHKPMKTKATIDELHAMISY